MSLEPEAVTRAVPRYNPRSAGAGAILEIFRDRRYQKLLAKSAALGVAIGKLQRVNTELAVLGALIGGIYMGLELAEYAGETDRPPAIDVAVIEHPEIFTAEIDEAAE